MKDKKSGTGKADQNLELNTNTNQQLLEQLTLEIIEKMENGEQLDFADYASRYPHLAMELQTNLANYWLEDRAIIQQLEKERRSPEYQAQLAAKLSNPQERHRISEALSKITAPHANPASHKAATSAQAKASETQKHIESLYKLGLAKGIKPPELARQVDLSSDIMMKLERRAFRLTSLPTELLNRLTSLLDITLTQLSHYLAASPQAATAQHFNLDKPETARQQDFAQAIQESEGLSPKQKTFWLHEAEIRPFTQD